MRKMKDSGIEWIGQIPDDWSIVRIKNVSSLFGRIGFRGYTQQDLVDEDDGAITLSPSNMKNMKMNYEKCSYISWFKYNESPEIKVENGDILFVKTGSTYGKSAYVTDLPKEATINPQLIVFKQSTMNKKLLAYVLQTSLISYQTELAVVGGTIPTMSQEKIKNFIFPIPPLAEQQRIADFLDEKCGEIDSIRSDVQREIEILNDYKKSVITEAVTKGLDPKAKLKDSGIEWIGRIPEYWEVKKTKYCFEFGKGLPITKENLEDSGISVISYGQIHSKQNNGTSVNSSLIRFVNESYLRTNPLSLVHKNDFIFADTSEDLDGCGNCVYIDTKEPIFAGYHTIIFRSKQPDAKYFAYLFLTDCWRSQIRKVASGVKLFSITQKILKETSVIIPPLSEQKEIADYLDEKCSEIDAIIADKQKQLETLDEYKKSLIFEYVTGKKEVI